MAQDYVRRMNVLEGLKPAILCVKQQSPVWAGHVSYVAVRPKLCKVHYLRIAAVGTGAHEQTIKCLFYVRHYVG